MLGEDSDEGTEKSIKLAEALGTDAGISIQRFTIYLPDRDRYGNEIPDRDAWKLEAMQLLSEINGGATAFPPVEGAWLNDTEAEPELIWETTVMIYSFIKPDSFLDNLPRLREFLHRFGRETNQGEVAFEFAGRFYRIRRFD